MGSSIYVGLAVTSHNNSLLNTSTFSNVSVSTSGNQAPLVNITSPGNNSMFTAPANILIKATASDAGGSVSKVEFYRGTTKLGEDVTSPYEFAWNNVSTGTYQLTAKAIDNLGLSATSTVVNVSVNTSSGQSVASFTLINAETDKDIGLLTDGYTINFATLGTNRLSVRANTSPAIVGSVVFTLDGVKVITENGAPYAIKGNSSTDYYAWTPTVGSHILTATPYSGSNASGTVGTPKTVQFTVVSTTARISQEESLSESSLQVYPNPFNKQATIEFTLPITGEATIYLYNSRGNPIQSLFAGKAEGGKKYSLDLLSGVLPDGLYLIRLTTKDKVIFRKVGLLR
jgi:hypothetical protein